MGRRHLLYLLYTSSARPPSFPPYFTAPPPPPPLLFRKGYWRGSDGGNQTMNHERAPSTLEEFKRLEEEKACRKVEKGRDGTVKEAVAAGDMHVGNSQTTGGSQSTK